MNFAISRGSPTRIITGTWWFFALIMLASYTANLAAFLTQDKMGSSIDSAEDLVKQTTIKYGAVDGGSTKKFFEASNFSTYQRMWAAMETAGASVHAQNNAEGVKRVLNGKYAFMMVC
jgi:glutamate receptor, ionotropic, invertebrate